MRLVPPSVGTRHGCFRVVPLHPQPLQACKAPSRQILECEAARPPKAGPETASLRHRARPLPVRAAGFAPWRAASAAVGHRPSLIVPGAPGPPARRRASPGRVRHAPSQWQFTQAWPYRRQGGARANSAPPPGTYPRPVALAVAQPSATLQGRAPSRHRATPGRGQGKGGPVHPAERRSTRGLRSRRAPPSGGGPRAAAAHSGAIPLEPSFHGRASPSASGPLHWHRGQWSATSSMLGATAINTRMLAAMAAVASFRR